MLRGLQLDYMSTADISLKSYLVGNVTEHIEIKMMMGMRAKWYNLGYLCSSPEKKVV